MFLKPYTKVYIYNNNIQTSSEIRTTRYLDRSAIQTPSLESQSSFFHCICVSLFGPTRCEDHLFVGSGGGLITGISL